jgi:uncharacterized protein YvpB
VKRTGLLLLTTGFVALISGLTFTSVHAVQNNESPKAALANAPKVAVQAFAHSLQKLSVKVKPGDAPAAAPETAAPAAPAADAGDASKANGSAAAAAEAKLFEVMQNGKLVDSFDTFAEAVAYAKTLQNVKVVYKTQNAVVWGNAGSPAGSAQIDVPLIEQMPELERGCEVTSLAMLLQSAGVNVDKMTLAQQVKKDPTPFEMKNGERYFGDPNRGFVGDIESFDNPGYGVYHGPIKELAEQYLPDRVVDATGADFTDLYGFLDQGIPVWTIVNMDYKPLSGDDFEQWQTPDGPIEITYKEHSVLVTGYDDEYIYINDPLNEADKVDKDSFIAAWEQMGKQAISYVPKLESKAGKT